MNGNCLDIGTIQAFLDGETRPDAAVKISEHVAGCDPCTILLAQAEEESSMVFSVLDRELNTLVPTQRLWCRINESIAEEKSRSSVWQRFLSFVTASIANPSFAAAAGLLLVVGMVAIVWTSKSSLTSDTGVIADARPTAGPLVADADPAPTNVPISNSASDGKQGSKIDVTTYSPQEIKRLVRNADFVQSGPRPIRREFTSAYVPGEESYIKTITELEQGVTAQNASMKASGQVAYERDMAVVDDSIKKMRQVVKRNPRNQAARQVLYSSYQDKIDLLKSSAQRGDLMASLQ